ncbi:tyrosine-type recombinase/integrase [Streptomyces sp. NPDC006129]|uniref:tyrosine-type recombinase/integrase n=1 Tax=unclassified Streptomyces TaxID=2593676 RepID=UPI0033B82F51
MENSSVKQYRTMLTRAVEPFFGADGVREITSAQIERWVEWMIHHRGYKPSTLRFRFSILMSVFDWAMERGLTDTNPCRPVKLPASRSRTHREQRAEVHIPSTETVLSVIAAAPERYRCMLWVMAGCGLRLGEAMGLGRHRISFADQLITVDRQVACDRDTGSGRYGSMRLRHVKWREDGEQGRRVPLPDVVAMALRRHLRDHVTWGDEELLFPNATGTGLLYPYYWYGRIWRPALAAAGVDYFKSHSLRHFYAASLLSQGVPVSEVSAWLGHTSVSFTERYYADLMPDAPDRARLAIDGALRADRQGAASSGIVAAASA